MQDNALALQLQSASNATFGGAVNAKGNLVSAANFVASKKGYVKSEGEVLTLKTLRERYGKDVVKPIVDEFNKQRELFFRTSKQLAALVVADPSMRVKTKIVRNKKMQVIGVNSNARFFSAKSVTKDARIAALEAEIAGMRKAQAALPAQA